MLYIWMFIGSPYIVDIKAPERHGRVRVWGPGIENGVLNNFQSNFWVDATGAGAGELRVRLMGPKGEARCLGTPIIILFLFLFIILIAKSFRDTQNNGLLT